MSPMREGNTVIGYQSVHVKPERQRVDRANKLYKKIMSGKSEDDKRRSKLDAVSLARFPLNITTKYMLAFILGMVPLALVSLIPDTKKIIN